MYRVERRVATGDSESLHLSLWGFKCCRWVTAETVAQILEYLPDDVLLGLRHIYYEATPLVPGYTQWVTAPPEHRLRGLYSRDERTILVQGIRSAVELFRVLFHEMGHHVYYSVLSGEERKNWVVDVWGSEPPVTDYGKRNAAEDFAELFAQYVLQVELLVDKPNKTRFVREVVFAGNPPQRGAINALIQN